MRKIFALFARHEIIGFILVIVINKAWKVHQLDMKSAKIHMGKGIYYCAKIVFHES